MSQTKPSLQIQFAAGLPMNKTPRMTSTTLDLVKLKPNEQKSNETNHKIHYDCTKQDITVMHVKLKVELNINQLRTNKSETYSFSRSSEVSFGVPRVFTRR